MKIHSVIDKIQGQETAVNDANKLIAYLNEHPEEERKLFDAAKLTTAPTEILRRGELALKNNLLEAKRIMKEVEMPNDASAQINRLIPHD